MGSIRTTGDTPKTWVLGLAKAVVHRLAKAARLRSKIGSRDASSPEAARSPAPWHTEPLTDDVSLLVITTCYQSYLDMQGMLAVFGALRGDEPEDALGAAPGSTEH